jgi:hypothetical protein
VKLRFAPPVAIGAMVLLAGCSSTSTPVASTSPSPVASPAPSSAAAASGFGDTAVNPDRPGFICAFLVNQAYFTVAGPDAAKAKAYCSTNEAAGFYPVVGTALPAGSYLPLTASTGCWIALGSDTIRVYAASPGVSTTRGWEVCKSSGVK